MNSGQIFFLQAVTCLLFFAHQLHCVLFLEGLHSEQPASLLRAAFFSLLKTGVFIAVYWVFPFNQFWFYCSSFLVYGIGIYTTSGRSRIGFFFWSNLLFVHFAAIYIIFQSVFSLVNHTSLPEAFWDPSGRTGIMLMTTLVLLLFQMIICKKISKKNISVMTNDSKRLRQVTEFLWYSFSYILADGILCMYSLSYEPLPLFIIGSSLLLELQIFMFILHAHKIALDSQYEAEYSRLLEERAEHIKKEMELKNLAFIDSLTGTYTRRYAITLLENLLSEGQCLSLAYLDINGLKKVNDTKGRPEGNRYLLMVSMSLNKVLRRGDTLARIGGDEFLIIAPDVSIHELKERLEKANEELNRITDFDCPPSFSFGVTEVRTGSTETAEELLRDADNLMYENKKKLHCRKEGSL